jgi:hypothetical protein
MVCMISLLFVAQPLAAQSKSVTTMGPYTWTNSCGQTIQITVTVDRKPPKYKGLYKWDYAIQNNSVWVDFVSLRGPVYLSLGISGADVFSPQGVPEIANLYGPANATVAIDNGRDGSPVGAGFVWPSGTGQTCNWGIYDDPNYPCWYPVSSIEVGQTVHFGFTTKPRTIASLQACPPDAAPGGSENSCAVAWQGIPLYLAGIPRHRDSYYAGYGRSHFPLVRLASFAASVSDSAFAVGRQASPVIPVGPRISRSKPHDAGSACNSTSLSSHNLTGPIAAPGDLLVLRAGTGKDASDPGTETTGAAQDTQAAFALGSQFFLQLARPNPKGGLTPIQATFALSDANVSIPPASDNIQPLFPNNVVIEFDQDKQDTIKKFQAVHLGTVNVTITPTDTSYAPVTVDVTIQNPKQLGQTDNYYDARIITLANSRGIPPQYIKGQIKRESGFEPKAYRYEPLGSDFLSFGPNGGNMRTQSPYADYRLAVNDGVADLNSKPWPTASPATQLPQGADLIPADVAPRSTTRPAYLMCALGLIIQGSGEDTCVGGSTTVLPTSDTPPQFVSVRELVDVNASQNWLTNVGTALRTRLTNNPSLMDFTAQTDLAASYGLLQVMYPTAISPMGWTGVNGARNPSYLFDYPDSRIDTGTSSLPLGTGYFARYSFVKANGRGLSTNPGFDGPQPSQDFAQVFEDAFNVYNHNSTSDFRGYGSQIVETFGPTFMPVPVATIFSTN